MGARNVVLGLVLMASLVAAVDMGTSSEVLDLDIGCSSKLDALWSKYTNSSGVEGCDPACLAQCNTVLQQAIYATKNKDCPLQSDIVRCFHVFSDDWEEYVEECELFAFEDSESESEGESSTDAESEAASAGAGRRRLLSAEGEAEGEGVAGGGCFPDFENAEDFEAYIDGQWQFSQPSNAAGIALSVAFFVGLVGLAMLLKT